MIQVSDNFGGLLLRLLFAEKRSVTIDLSTGCYGRVCKVVDYVK